jgi:uncharacterized protein (TIGR03086 family)
MTEPRPAATLSGGVALLERAVGYTLGQLHAVTTADLSRPTPCAGWDLRELLEHMDDSLAAVTEALDVRHVDAVPGPGYGPAGSAVSLTGTLRDRACRLLGALARPAGELVWVGGFPVPVGVVTSTGAVDVAVHGWDVGRACGHARPIPGQLAEAMLEILPLLVTGADRPVRFAAPVAVPPLASASDRLLAYLGRDPSA